ncbi:hypothetical protein U9M48_003899, partial [Paspalum notatum var. saurae]
MRTATTFITHRTVRYAVPTCLNYYGLWDTTSSYAVIFLNMIPLITFILSVVLRMERLPLGTVTGSQKIVGILLSIGGTMVISFYKGKALHLWGSILQHHNEPVPVANHHLRGTIFLLGSTFTFACWYPIQSMVNKTYPHRYWSSMATCFLGGLQTTLIGIILRRDRNTWKLGWNLQLLTIVYMRAFATAVRYNLESWVVAKRGPAYPPMFIPLITVFTAVLGSIFLGDIITVGRLAVSTSCFVLFIYLLAAKKFYVHIILGAATVITGLYVFLWGKSKECAE